MLLCQARHGKTSADFISESLKFLPQLLIQLLNDTGLKDDPQADSLVAPQSHVPCQCAADSFSSPVRFLCIEQGSW